MKKILAILLAVPLLFHAAEVSAQKEKIVERSAKRAPAWVGITTSDYFAASGRAATLADAQADALNQIRQYVISSVAVNVTSVESSFAGQRTKDEVAEVLKRYSSQVDTEAAAMPFLTDLSLSNAEEVYWEKVYVKASGSYFYNYHVKYPFTASQRLALTTEFLRIDRARYAEFQRLKALYDTFTTVEEIDRAIAELDPLIEYFFDRARRGEAEALQRSYRNAYANIAIVPLQEQPESCIYALECNGRKITTTKTPQLKSPTAVDLAVHRNNDDYLLTYDCAYSRPEDENYINIAYLFGGRRVHRRLTFDPMEGRLSLQPCGQIKVWEIAAENGAGCTVTVEIALRSRTDAAFTVVGALLDLPESSCKIESGALEQTFSGSGVKYVRFDVPFTAGAGEHRLLAEGSLRVRNGSSGDTSELAFSLPYELKLMSNH